MVALDNLIHITETTGPQVISHFNLFRSAEIDGSAAPGVSSGQAIAAMQSLAEKTLPRGFSLRLVRTVARGDPRSGGRTVVLFALGLLVVYLTLAAQYESFALPFIILLAVPVAILGALAATALRGLGRRLRQIEWLVDAHRPGGQELDPHRRVRRAAARPRAQPHRGGDRGGARSGCGPSS